MMDRGIKLSASILVVSLMAACGTAQVPYTQNFPVSNQKVSRAANHWDVIADDVAQQTVAVIGTQKTIYVATASESTNFNRAFHNFLTTRMVNKGISISIQKTGAIEIQYETQIVRHNSERKAYQPGTITMLAAGLMVAYNVPNWAHTADKAAAMLGLAAGADVAASTDSGSPTNTELVVTTSVIEGGRYLVRKTDIYYIQPEDVRLFMDMDKGYIVVGGK